MKWPIDEMAAASSLTGTYCAVTGEENPNIEVMLETVQPNLRPFSPSNPFRGMAIFAVGEENGPEYIFLKPYKF